MPMPYDVHAATRAIARTDTDLAKLIEMVGPCRLPLRRPKDPFRALLRAIVYQQISGSAAGAINSRLLALFPDQRPTPELLLTLSDKALRDVGLSRQKVVYVRDLAERMLNGELPSARACGRMTDEEIVQQAIVVKGIGRWTVEMLLIFHLGRPDVFPVDDLAVRKGFMMMRGETDMPKPKFLLNYGEIWRPWRSVASWYLWRATDSVDFGSA